MQIIIPYAGTPERYISNTAHLAIPPPTKCFHCGYRGSFEALGYYKRGLSAAKRTKVLTISVRRFRCRNCKGTVSMLPAFAQPYRLVRNSIVEQFFSHELKVQESKPWHYLLRRYWKKFILWIPQLDFALFKWRGRPPPNHAEAWWHFLLRTLGDLEEITRELATNLQITLFGSYRCHRPKLANT